MRLFFDMCDAVQHAHEQAVIHRDIKPSNVPRDPERRHQAAGFRHSRNECKTRVAPMSGRARGCRCSPRNTPRPEQFRGQVGGAADVYALGMMLFELIAGTLPYRMDEVSADSLAAAIRAGYPAQPPPK